MFKIVKLENSWKTPFASASIIVDYEQVIKDDSLISMNFKVFVVGLNIIFLI